MAHNSGIPICPALEESFGNARTVGGARFLRIEIVDDKLVETASHPVSDSLEADFDQLPNYFQGKTPCYIVFRLDSKNDQGFQWMLCSYVPDGSPVRQRMLYGSTRELLKRHLGSTFFASDMHGSSVEDFTFAAFLQLKSKTIDAPLTEAEIVHKSEASMEVDYGHTREYVHSVSFPISAAGLGALRSLPSGANNLVQLRLDTEQETVELHANTSTSASALADTLPTAHPCFNFFRYDHDFGGERQSPVIFVYSCPEDSKIKERMLYSTVKAAATGAAEDAGVRVAKKFEVADAADLTEDVIHEELHPAAAEVVTKPALSRPARAGRGRPRMIKK